MRPIKLRHPVCPTNQLRRIRRPLREQLDAGLSEWRAQVSKGAEQQREQGTAVSYRRLCALQVRLEDKLVLRFPLFLFGWSS